MGSRSVVTTDSKHVTISGGETYHYHLNADLLVFNGVYRVTTVQTGGARRNWYSTPFSTRPLDPCPVSDSAPLDAALKQGTTSRVLTQGEVLKLTDITTTHPF